MSMVDDWRCVGNGRVPGFGMNIACVCLDWCGVFHQIT